MEIDPPIIKPEDEVPDNRVFDPTYVVFEEPITTDDGQVQITGEMKYPATSSQFDKEGKLNRLLLWLCLSHFRANRFHNFYVLQLETFQSHL